MTGVQTCALPIYLDEIARGPLGHVLEDLESGEQIPVVPQSFRAEYRRLIQEHIAKLQTMFSEQRIDYAQISTAEPLDRALFSYLSSRAKLMKVR